MNTAIIVLNWNGWQDTIECLESLKESTISDFTTIVVDNGSSDDSLEKIRAWMETSNSTSGGNPRKLIEFSHEQIPKDLLQLKPGDFERLPEYVLIKNKENLGFAGGNNIGILFTIWADFKTVFLLNNDTTVIPSCLEILLTFMEKNKKYPVVTPMICYYDKPNKVWNCGGKLTWWGSRKYYFHNKNSSECKVDIKEITFITGCALMVKTDIFKKYGLLSEQFFLGEEDYEFSIRMRNVGVKMAAISEALIYHKISSTKELVFQNNILSGLFIYYLNRFIDLKGIYSDIYWQVWRIASLGYILPMLRFRYRISIKRLMRFTGLLFNYSSKRDVVTKDDFFQARILFPESEK